MSLVNQMLRDLQQRQNGRSAMPPEVPARPSRRRLSITKLVGTVPPLCWVGAGGVAGVVLIWGFSSWLAGVSGPGSPGPVPQPPANPVAIANAPRPAATELPPAPVLPAAASASRASSPVVARKSGTGHASSAPVAARIPGVVVNPPDRLHPDLLPGAVNATSLALQKVAREAAVPPVVTPYGQAEAAYREGRQAYATNHGEISIAALRRALSHYPGHLAARELLADQLEMAGRTDEALTQLKQGLTIAPDYPPFRKRAARILLDRGDAAGATRTLIGNGLPRVEEDPELHLLLAGTYLRLGENFLAAQTFRNLLVDAPQDGRTWVGLGDALAADGQPAEARKAYRRALAVGGLSREDAGRAEAGSGPR